MNIAVLLDTLYRSVQKCTEVHSTVQSSHAKIVQAPAMELSNRQSILIHKDR